MYVLKVKINGEWKNGEGKKLTLKILSFCCEHSKSASNEILHRLNAHREKNWKQRQTYTTNLNLWHHVNLSEQGNQCCNDCSLLITQLAL